MADATTANYGWTKPTVGADADNWGGVLNGDLDAIDATVRAAVPAGAIVFWAGSTTAPSGYLLCDGTAVSRTTYAGLFNAIGTIHGAGDGSTTFNVPNLLDRFIVGAGNSYGVAAQGGATSSTPTITVAGHSLTTPELPAHSHGASDSGHVHALSSNLTGANISDGGHAHGLSSWPTSQYYGTNGPSTGVAGFPPGGTVLAVGVPTATDASGSNLTFTDPTHSHTVAAGFASVSIGSTGNGAAHTHTASSNAVPTLPPYYALCYIVKT